MGLQWGIDDPEAWLDSVDEKQLALWQAYYKVEPYGAEWERHAEMMSVLDSIYAVAINQLIPDEDKHRRHRPRAPREFLPNGYYPPEKKPSLTEQLASVAKAVTKGS